MKLLFQHKPRQGLVWDKVNEFNSSRSQLRNYTTTSPLPSLVRFQTASIRFRGKCCVVQWNISKSIGPSSRTMKLPANQFLIWHGNGGLLALDDNRGSRDKQRSSSPGHPLSIATC